MSKDQASSQLLMHSKLGIVVAWSLIILLIGAVGWAVHSGEPTWASACVALGALCVALFSLQTAWVAVTRTYRPVVVFVREEDQRWKLVNIGKGPALDIIVAEYPEAGKPPTRFVRYPSLGDGKEFLFEPNVGETVFEAQYRNAEDTLFVTRCERYLNVLLSNPTHAYQDQPVRLYGEIQDRKCLGRCYLLQLQPSDAPRRVAIGYTHNLDEHEQVVRKEFPHAKVLESWPCMRSWEIAAVASIVAQGFSSKDGNVYTGDPDGFRQRATSFFEMMPPVDSE